MKKLLLFLIPILSISQINYNLNWLDKFENELNFENLSGTSEGTFPSFDTDYNFSGHYKAENSYFLGFGDDGEIAYLIHEYNDYEMEVQYIYKIVIIDSGTFIENELILWEYWESYGDGEYYDGEEDFCFDYCDDCCDLYCLDSEAVNYCSDCHEDDVGDCCYVRGCTNSNYFEYNPNACFGNDYDECLTVKVGCTNPGSINFCKSCIEDDGSCIPIIKGCIDEFALNYNPDANTQDGSCKKVTVKSIWKEKQKEINTFLDENFIDPNPIFNFFEEGENKIIFPSSRDFPPNTLFNIKEYSNENYLDEFNLSDELFNDNDNFDRRVKKSIGLNIYCPVKCNDLIDDIFYSEILKIPTNFINQQYSLLSYSKSPIEPVVVLIVAFWKFNEDTGKKDVSSVQSVFLDVSATSSLSFSTNKKDFIKSFITYKDYINNVYNSTSRSVKIENYKKAISLLENDMKQDNFIYEPNGYDLSCIYYSLANTYKYDKKYDLAISNYNKSIEHLIPSYDSQCGHSKESIYRALASLYSDAGDYSESAEYYTKIINSNNKLTDIQKANLYYDRGKVYSKSNYSSDLENAIEDLLFAENIYKVIGNQTYKQSLCFFYCGWSSYELEDYQSSIDYYTKSIELRPDDSAAYNNRGNCYAEVSLDKFAIKDYDKAINLNPNKGLYYSNKASSLKKIGEPYCDFYKKACELGYQNACGRCY